MLMFIIYNIELNKLNLDILLTVHLFVSLQLPLSHNYYKMIISIKYKLLVLHITCAINQYS